MDLSARTELYCHLEPNAQHIATGDFDSIADDLLKDDVLLILDGIPPPTDIKARVILISSPDEDIWKQANKDFPSVLTFFMPVWTLQEIKQCRSQLDRFESIIPEEKASRLYTRWGGIPRYVLVKTDDEIENQRAYDALFARQTWKDLAASIDEAANKRDVSNRLALLYVKDETFRSVEVRLTLYTQTRLFEKLIQGSLEEQKQIIATRFRSEATGQMFGYFFESFMHRELTYGTTLRMRSLDAADDANVIYTVKIPRRQRFIFDDVSGIESIPANVYAVPKVNNLAAIDSLYLPQLLLQCTSASTHAVKGPRLKEIISAAEKAVAANATKPSLSVTLTPESTSLTSTSTTTDLSSTKSKRKRSRAAVTAATSTASSSLSQPSTQKTAELAKLNLVWVVPTKLFLSFSAQPILTADKKLYAREDFKNLKQWVMELAVTVPSTVPLVGPDEMTPIAEAGQSMTD